MLLVLPRLGSMHLAVLGALADLSGAVPAKQSLPVPAQLQQDNII